MLYFQIIDSGEGGLAFKKSIEEKNSNNIYDLFLDREFFPYGLKTKEELAQRLEYLLQKTPSHFDGVILACNTLSVVYLTNNINSKIMIYDVVSPTISYLNKITYNHLTILATTFTINSNYYQNHLHNKNIQTIICDKLIAKIEKGQDYIDLLEEVINIIDSKTDYILLGCTHFIKIKDIFRNKTSYNTISQDEIF